MTLDNFIANASVIDGLVKNQPTQAGAASNQRLRELENTEGSFDTALENAVNDSQKEADELSPRADSFDDGWQNLPSHSPEIAALLQHIGQGNLNMDTGLEDVKGDSSDITSALQHMASVQPLWRENAITQTGLEDVKGDSSDVTLALQHMASMQLLWRENAITQAGLEDFEGSVSEAPTFLQYFGSMQSTGQNVTGQNPGLNDRIPLANPSAPELISGQLNDAFAGRFTLSTELLDLQAPKDNAFRELTGIRSDVPVLSDLAGVKNNSQRPGTLAGGAEISLQTKEPEVFATGLATYLRVLKTEGGTEARLQLSPIELGKLAITIQTEGEETRVSFVVENSQARSTVESSLPRLRDMLEQSGLSLSDAEVTEKNPNEKDTEYKADSHNEDSLDDDIQSDKPTTAVSADSSLLLDAYA